jgi:4-amino-4-deoxy-L-arabinose transferase-like glycosyltransferase
VSEAKLSSRTLFAVFALAFSLRAAYVLIQYHYGVVVGAFVSGDSPLYIGIAENILAGNGIAYENEPTAFVSPGFPVFLALCFGIFGANPVWASLAQCVLSALLCVFTTLTAAEMFGRKAGIIAGIIAAVYFELILWTSGQILTEPLYSFLLAAAVYTLVRASVSENSSNWKFALSGLLFGLSALVRPLALAVALGLGILILFVFLLHKREQIKKPLIFMAFCLLIMQPWGIRNYFVFNHYLLLSSEGGFVFWLGNNPEYDRYEHPDFQRFGGYTAMFKPPPELAIQLRDKTEAEQNQFFARQALRHIYDQPGAFLTRALHKTWNMWRPTFSGSSFQNKLISFTVYPLLLLLSLFGIFLAWRKALAESFNLKNFLLHLTKPVGLLCVFLLIHLLIHAVINGEIRFRVPLWTALIPFAAFTITYGLNLLKLNNTTKTS